MWRLQYVGYGDTVRRVQVRVHYTHRSNLYHTHQYPPMPTHTHLYRTYSTHRTLQKSRYQMYLPMLDHQIFFHSPWKPDKIYIQVVPTQLSKHNVFVHTRFVQTQRVLWSQRPHTTSPHTPSPYTTCPHTWEGMAIGGSHRPCLWTG